MARSLRPTLPLADWRIATHLSATQAVQNQPGTPAFGCQCVWCQNWKRIAQDTLPLELLHQLGRLGVRVEQPADLYPYSQSNADVHCRVVYYVVGKLLSGPAAWREDEKLGRMRMYHEIRPAPQFLSIAVLPHRQTHDVAPVMESEADGDLIQIDFRLQLSIPEGVDKK